MQQQYYDVQPGMQLEDSWQISADMSTTTKKMGNKHIETMSQTQLHLIPFAQKHLPLQHTWC